MHEIMTPRVQPHIPAIMPFGQPTERACNAASQLATSTNAHHKLALTYDGDILFRSTKVVIESQSQPLAPGMLYTPLTLTSVVKCGDHASDSGDGESSSPPSSFFTVEEGDAG